VHQSFTRKSIITHCWHCTAQVMTDHGWVQRNWTNNNAESMNHVLKMKADWRQLPVQSVIDNCYDVVRLRFIDLRSALTGRGSYTVVPALQRHVVPNREWSALSAEQKADKFDRFLRDNGSRCQPTTVVAKDGGLTLPATPRVARKPCQRSRPRAVRTRSVRK
jgi:hypothetical protein